MRILSYRGPSAPGGVSNAVTQIFDYHEQNADWWYIDDNNLRHKNHKNTSDFDLDHKSTALHYAYCNNFLWPILHDLPQFARYDKAEHQGYRAFNYAVAFRLRSNSPINETSCFVNDYQFALVPNVLKNSVDSLVFWHIPWPKTIAPEYTNALVEIASGLLNAILVGFHTAEYRDNFFHFVEENMPLYQVNMSKYNIRPSDRILSGAHSTKFVVAPLGLDSEHWQDLSRLASITAQNLAPQNVPFVLSVDRADYTKGIVERLDAIEVFFENYPQWQKKISFLQIGTRSREGLNQFDAYWQECQQKYESLNERFATSEWQPLIWKTVPKSAADLAVLYSRSEAMLVSPVRDGLNLTAKEFIMCQGSSPGVLGLSRGAGAWTEIGQNCVELDPSDANDYAQSILRCLEMKESEKIQRSSILKVRVGVNSLDSWWQNFKHAYRSARSENLALQRQSDYERICS